MNWEAVAAVGEILGAIAVVISLVYLAAQIRQNTRQVEEQARAHQVASMSSVGQGFSSWRTLIAGSSENAAVWEKGGKDLAGLSPAERKQYDFLLVEMFWAFAQPWIYVQQGVFEKEMWEQAKNNIRVFSNPGVQQWWQESVHRAEYPPAFSEAVDEVIGSPEKRLP